MVATALSLAAILLAASAASAGETRVQLGFFCEGAPEGVGTLPCNPTFSNAYSLAVHQSDGDVIVLDASAKTIRRFKSNGEPDPFSALGTNLIDGQGSGGGPGSGGSCVPVSLECDETPENGLTVAGGFAQEAQIAVDSSGGATDGDIYVTQKNASGLHLVDIFDSTGEYIGQLTGAGGEEFAAPDGVAVTPEGDLFVSDFKAEKIFKYIPAGQPPVNADGSLFYCFEEAANPAPGCVNKQEFVEQSGSNNIALIRPGRLAAGTGPSAGALFASTRSGPTFKLDSNGKAQCTVQGLSLIHI